MSWKKKERTRTYFSEKERSHVAPFGAAKRGKLTMEIDNYIYMKLSGTVDWGMLKH